jgi:transposase
VLTNLIPAGADRNLTAERAAELLRGIRPHDAAGKTLRGLVADLVTEVRQLDRRIAKAASDIQAAVTDSGATLTELCGIGALTAGKILGRVGTIDRFRSASAFATYTGTAPIDASSGDIVRHRLSRAGDRQLNLCLHVMALTQFGRTPLAGRITYASEAKARVTKKRCGASNDGCPTLSTDNSATTQTDWRQAREDTRGRLEYPARPAQTPHTDASDKSLPGPTESHPTTDGNPPLDTERRRLHTT